MDTPNNAAVLDATPQVTTDAPVTGPENAPNTNSAPTVDLNNLPPEFQPIYKQLEENFSKKYQGYEDYQKRANSFDEALRDPSFAKWYNERLNPQTQAVDKTPAVEDLTPEQFAGLLNDPKQFSQFINERANAIAEQKLAPKLAETQNAVEIMKRQNELESFGKTHDDFWKLDEKGLIEPLIRKYPKADLEDIWKIARHDLMQKEAIDKAHGIVRNKQMATTERPGVSTSQTAGVVKVKNRSEAMQIAAQYHSAGRQPPEFVFETTR